MAVARSDDAAQAPGWKSIEELFAALESPLLGYALRIVGERGTAEDLVQDAFMKLHAQFEEVREPERWLYRTVHNLALNHRRDNAKLVSRSPSSQDDSTDAMTSTDTADTQPLPDEQIARMEGIGLVRLCLKSLDKRSREIIRLKFNEDLSYADISKRTGLKSGHVGYLLHHALKAIATELAKTGMTKP